MLPLLLLLSAADSPKITVDFSKPGVAVSPTLYGLMTEEINHSYDGGLYGELVRNRAFKDDSSATTHWAAVGEGASIGLNSKSGASLALSSSLEVVGGVANDGYWGFPIHPLTPYKLKLWAKADAPGPIFASLQSVEGSTTYAKASVKGISSEWKQLEVTLRTRDGIKATKDARLVLLTGAKRKVWLSMVSLFPPTFKNRPNGNRPDLMRLLTEMKPKFLRFPGGNYLEGNTFKDRFYWKNTIGPVEDRPGHQAPWGYRSSDGMGLLEFLEWTEEMGAKPVLAVFAGYVLNGTHVDAGPKLEPYVREALEEIEYVTGGPETRLGAQRIKDGHPAPFPLPYVEIGNEDGFDRSGSYEKRFVQFYDAIKAKYPKIQLISTTGGKDSLGRRFPITMRKPDVFDEHYYASASDMMALASKYDDYDRNGPKVFVGEWASQDVPEPWRDVARKGPTPNMNCALADAAFMTGLERNSDIVKISCYAPLLVNVNPNGRQWAVNLIGYDAINSFGSPSYYAQQMFAKYLGDRTVPAILSDIPTETLQRKTLPSLYVSVTRDTRSRQIFIKIVNPFATAQKINIDLKSVKVSAQGEQITLAGDPKSMNTIDNPKFVSPVLLKRNDLSSNMMQSIEPYSINVLELQAVR